MAFNGSGTFNRVHNWVTDKGNSVPITASRCDTEDDGFATGLSTCITKDGQTTLTADIPFATQKITGLGNGSARTDSIALGQVQDNTYGNLGASSGTDTYTATPSPAITAYVASQRFTVEIGADNTGAATLNINAVGAEALEKYDGAGSIVALEAGDVQAGQKYDVIRNQANSKFIVLNPQLPYIDGANITNIAYPTASDTVAGIIEIATQAEQETGTSTTLAVVPGRQQYHASASKAWAETNSGASVVAGYNVASMTDNGTGDYTFNYSVNMSSSSYCAIATPDDGGAANRQITIRTKATTSVTVDLTNGTSNVDNICYVAVFGDQ